VSKLAEDGKVALRNVRRDAIKAYDKLERWVHSSSPLITGLSAENKQRHRQARERWVHSSRAVGRGRCSAKKPYSKVLQKRNEKERAGSSYRLPFLFLCGCLTWQDKKMSEDDKKDMRIACR